MRPRIPGPPPGSGAAARHHPRGPALVAAGPGRLRPGAQHLGLLVRLHVVAFPLWTVVIGVVYATYLHARATSGRSRQSAGWMALAGWACIIVNNAVVNVFFVGQPSHSEL